MPKMFGRRSRFTILATLALGAALVFAVLAGHGFGSQASAADPVDQTGSISVNGQATLKVDPDTVSLSLGVIAQAATASEAMNSCSAKMDKVISAVKSAGVPAANIQTSNISLGPIYKYDPNGSDPVITGYQAQNQVSVTWKEIGKVGALIDAAVQAGANNAYGIAFTASDASSHYLEALAAAVRDARAKADALAAAAGCRVGKVKSLSCDSYSPGPVYRQEMKLASDALPAPIEPGQVDIQVNVSVVYGIE